MARSLFSKGSSYPWYRQHEGAGLSPTADQQIGAGIMWTCGIFWAVPAMIVAVRRLIDLGRHDDLEPGSESMVIGGRRALSRRRQEVIRHDVARERSQDPPERAELAGRVGIPLQHSADSRSP